MDELQEALLALRAAVAEVRTQAHALDELGEPPDYEELALVFAALGDLAGDLREARADVGEAAHHAMPDRYGSVPGWSEQIERTWGSDRSAWHHDELFDLVLARARDERKMDPETGEYEDPAVVALRVLRECAGISYWKLGNVKERTGLRGRGIDPDEYCTTTPKRVSISIPSYAKRSLAAEGREEAPEAPQSAASV